MNEIIEMQDAKQKTLKCGKQSIENQGNKQLYYSLKAVVVKSSKALTVNVLATTEPSVLAMKLFNSAHKSLSTSPSRQKQVSSLVFKTLETTPTRHFA